MTITQTSDVARFAEVDPESVFNLIIGGKEVPAVTGEIFRCVDPYDGVEWGRVALGSAEDVDRAVRSAREAFPRWRDTFPTERAAIIKRWAQLIIENTDRIARLQVHENGKTITENRLALGGAAAIAEQSAHLGIILQGVSQLARPGVDAWTRHEPLGVIAAIAPWNNPLSLLSTKLFPALAAGNTVVVKPSEVTPVTTLELVKLGIEAGLPDGVVNVVTGAGATGAALVKHPGIAKVAFTGSTATGRRIAESVASRLIPATFELGGKGPNIVFEDADIDRAVAGLLTGMTAAAGQACNAGSRILLAAPVYDEVIEKLNGVLAALRVGDPLDPKVEMGPLASRPQYDKVCSYLDIAAEEGLTRLAGGRRGADFDPNGTGLFVEPTLFASPDGRNRLMQEEIFGPVAGAVRFETEEEAIVLANGVDFGLVAGFWTQSVDRSHRLIPKLDAGTVWVNTWRTFSLLIPFGGFKDSGLGYEYGVESVKQYTHPKAAFVAFQ